MDMACKLPVTFCNITDITPATKRNKSDIAPVTVCNISELKRTKPLLMTEHINHKALKMNTSPQPQNAIFETHQKPATKRNKAELNRTNSKVPTWGADSYRYRGPIATGKKIWNMASKRNNIRRKSPVRGFRGSTHAGQKTLAPLGVGVYLCTYGTIQHRRSYTDADAEIGLETQSHRNTHQARVGADSRQNNSQVHPRAESIQRHPHHLYRCSPAETGAEHGQAATDTNHQRVPGRNRHYRNHR